MDTGLYSGGDAIERGCGRRRRVELSVDLSGTKNTFSKQIIGASRHGRLRPLSPLIESLSALTLALSPAISRHPVPRLPRPVKRGRILIRTLTSSERVHEARVRHARHLDPPAGPTKLTAAGSSIHIHTHTHSCYYIPILQWPVPNGTLATIPARREAERRGERQCVRGITERQHRTRQTISVSRRRRVEVEAA